MIADRLRELRLQKNLSQSELGKRIGVPQTTLSGWERNEGCPNIKVLPGLAENLGVSIMDLLAEIDKNNKLEKPSSGVKAVAD